MAGAGLTAALVSAGAERERRWLGLDATATAAMHEAAPTSVLALDVAAVDAIEPGACEVGG